MNVGSMMSRNVITCRPEHSLSDAAKIMWESDCGSVPVVDDSGKAIGMITDRDICMAAFMRDQSPSKLTVSSVLTNKLVVVHESDSVEAAEQQMQQHQVRRLPVTDQGGKPVGMLSLNDLARSVLHGQRSGAEKVLETLVAIGTPRAAAEAQ
jgi:CBS domain-containing protein